MREVVSHVSIKRIAGWNMLTVASFMSLPLDERIKLVLNREVQFLNSEGQVIPPRAGLEALSHWKPEVGNGR